MKGCTSKALWGAILFIVLESRRAHTDGLFPRISQNRRHWMIRPRDTVNVFLHELCRYVRVMNKQDYCLGFIGVRPNWVSI